MTEFKAIAGILVTTACSNSVNVTEIPSANFSDRGKIVG
jgi:hypothetical protein